MKFLQALLWKAKISKKEALLLARLECEKQGVNWKEPIHIASEWRYWHITTNTHSIGGNVHIIVDKRTGTISALTITPK